MSDEEKAKQLVFEVCQMAGAYTVIWAVSMWMEKVLLEAPHIKMRPDVTKVMKTTIQRLRETANGMLM